MKLPAAVLLAALAFAPAAVADTLLIQRAKSAEQMNVPLRGHSMASVEAEFGKPLRKHAPVGGGSRSNPPITRWDYEEFSVYFEHGHVVNSVLTKGSELEIGPAPARG